MTEPASALSQTMLRHIVFLLCLALAACARHSPAPLVTCSTLHGTIDIEGSTQPAISTYCRDEQGEVTLGH